MPAEWEPHRATWIAWPHHEPDWPGKLEAVYWVYAEIVRLIAAQESVEILCTDGDSLVSARQHVDAHGVPRAAVRYHVVPTDRVWLRDSAPTFVRSGSGSLEAVNWRFNAWAKYDNWSRDVRVGAEVARLAGVPLANATHGDNEHMVLEGGAIDCDGRGTLLTTEECLLSPVQARNPGLDRASYESAFREYLGVSRTIWLGRGCAGDDTHGHVDDVARFVAPGIVALAFEEDPSDDNHEASLDNFERLGRERDAAGSKLRVARVPFPRPVMMLGQRLPASYLNFYITNGSVLVPTFNDPADRMALNIFADLFPGREVVGVHSVDLVWGLGTMHCLTQQEPLPSSPS
jgi:agmatine deiminase